MDFVADNMNYIIAAAVVIAALVLAMMVVRALGGRVRGRRGSRLSISEYHEIDTERRLILVRRDDREHLLLIGGNQDIVVESGIETEPETEQPARARRFAPRRETSVQKEEGEGSRPIPIRSSPRPAVFGDYAPSLRPVGRDEPRLSSVPAKSDDGDN